MKWTTEKPTQPGWYWFRGELVHWNCDRDTIIASREYREPRILEVVPGVNALRVQDEWTCRQTQMGTISLADAAGEWAGPIDSPAPQNS